MAFDDCYTILGVPRDANAAQVRRACRNLCHKFDPDREDDSLPAMFCRVTHAFETLSDAGACADHQREIMRREVAGGSPTTHHLCPPRNLFDDFEDYRPSVEALRRAFVDNVLDRLPKSRPVHPIRVRVTVLGPRRDGVIPFRVPAAKACPSCGGNGRLGTSPCDDCGGEGVTWAMWRVDVPVPAGAFAPGAAGIPVSLVPIEVNTLFLDVQVQSPTPRSYICETSINA